MAKRSQALIAALAASFAAASLELEPSALDSMTRPELEDVASKLGIDPEVTADLDTKADVVQAIEQFATDFAKAEAGDQADDEHEEQDADAKPRPKLSDSDQAVHEVLSQAYGQAGLSVDPRDTNLDELSRDQLNSVATKLGIEQPGDLGSHEDLCDKILEVADEKAEAILAGLAERAAIKTVRMTRDAEVHPKGPHSADVHPDEVENFKAAGWKVAK